MRSSITGRITSSGASVVWHVAPTWLKPNVGNILLSNFCEQKFGQPGPITIPIDCNDLSLLIFEEKWPNYAYGPKSARNSFSFWRRRLFNVCVPIFCAPKVAILLVYIPAKIKMSFIWKDNFFFWPKSASFVSRSAAILPIVVQAYLQSYSFGGSIKLIICQIRHELSVTIHDISTSWKKNVRWRTQYFKIFLFFTSLLQYQPIIYSLID